MTVDDVDPTPSPRRRPKNRKQLIARAASRRFAAAGYAATGISDIADDVGIAGSAIYRHFASKAILLEHLLTNVSDRLIVVREQIATDVPTGAPAVAELERILGAFLEVALDDASGFATYIRERESLTGPSARRLADEDARLVSAFECVLQRASPRLDESTIIVRRHAAGAALGSMANAPEGFNPQDRTGAMVSAVSAMLLCPNPRVSAPPPDPRPEWTPPEVRADAILRKAVALFKERGYHNVGIEDIAAAAGIATSGLYRMYGSKADILTDAYDRAGGHVVAAMDDALASATSSIDAMCRVMHSYVRLALHQADVVAITGHEGTLPESERPRLARRRRLVRGTWLALLRELRPQLDVTTGKLLVQGVYPIITTSARQREHFVYPEVQIAAMAFAFLGLPDAAVYPQAADGNGRSPSARSQR